MAIANVKRGNYYKTKTKEWFIERGFECEYLERYIKKGRFYSKKDLFGCDGLAVDNGCIVFWSCKSSENIKKRYNEMLKEAKEEFSKKIASDKKIKKLVFIWEVGNKNPFIHDIN